MYQYYYQKWYKNQISDLKNLIFEILAKKMVQFVHKTSMFWLIHIVSFVWFLMKYFNKYTTNPNTIVIFLHEIADNPNCTAEI